MRRQAHSLVTLCSAAQLAILLSAPLSADLYSNGPVNGEKNAWAINDSYQVADSFSLAATSTLQSVTFDVWLPQTIDVGGTVDWSIVGNPTMQASTLDASGTEAALADAPVAGLQPNGQDYFVHGETFSLPSVKLGQGVYYLTLQNFTVVNSNTSIHNSDEAFWDENDGPSAAWQNGVGYLQPSTANGCQVTSGYCSETFKIDGTIATPELDSVGLVATEILILAVVMLRKRIRPR